MKSNAMKSNAMKSGKHSTAPRKVRIKHPMIYLLVGIPLASVLMGVLTLYLAFGYPNQEIDTHQTPMSKTSWQDGEQRDN